ncbi:hypothetical protein Fmac_011223 [Flemingia macrophylla]|uniref:SANT domain-containing protein n=1 Tax=Flemingia macrophylla TaxID=520843 RepID=A0ABD1MLT6_9FABA
MESILQNYSDDSMEHSSNSPPCLPDINDIVGAPQLNPRVGEEYQVEVASMKKESERLQLLMNSADSELMHHDSLSFAIGLPISVTWMHNEVEDNGHEGYLADIDGKVYAIVLEKEASIEKSSLSGNEEELKLIVFRSVMTGDRNSGQVGKSKNYVLVPGTLNNSWSEDDAKSFLLGLFIFGKNFIKIKKFLENKGMGEIMSFYYGTFYKSDEHRRWSDCRKIKGRKCIIGQKLLTGQRQHELLSRLIPHVSEESRETLLQVSQLYVEGRASLEEYIFSIKSTVGLGVLVEAVGIGKEKGDLTSPTVELGKNNRVFPFPTSKAWSSLGPSDIIKHLTGGFRLSKAKSNDLFWEAVWPRLLARGWHSEQPKNQSYVRSKDYLVFLIPGVKKFSRRKLVKGDHYFDSVSDVLSKIVAEPNLLELEDETNVGSCNDEEPDKGSSKDDQSDYHRPCYLKPRSSSIDHIKFMVIDTSLVNKGKSSDLMEFKSVPVKSVGKAEVNAAGITYKEAKHVRKVNRGKDVHENIDQKLPKFTVIDTSMLYEGKTFKVRELRGLPVGLEYASKMTILSRGSMDSSSDEDSPSMVEANMQTCDKKNISNAHSQKGISDRDVTNQKEACDKPDNNAIKMEELQKNQRTCVFEDNQQMKTIKQQFSRRARSDHCNHTVIPVKRRRLAACAKADTSDVIDNSLGGLEYDNSAFSQSSSFTDSHQNFSDQVSHQPNESLVASPADTSAEVNNEKIILNEIGQCMGNSCVQVEKCESKSQVTFNAPQVPLKSKDGEMTAPLEENGQCLKANDMCLSTNIQGIVEKPQRSSCDVGSVEPNFNTNPRRQSTRNRPLTVKALESLANEFLHVQRKQKKKDILSHLDAFSPCRRARTRGKTNLRRGSSDHGTAVLVKENHLKGDRKVEIVELVKHFQATGLN